MRKVYNSSEILVDSAKFDPYEAFRMNYSFNGIKIRNAGFLNWHFRSGVGHEKDCKLSVGTILIESNKSEQLNLEPTHYTSQGILDLSEHDFSNLAITL